jgi:hypothetical protein
MIRQSKPVLEKIILDEFSEEAIRVLNDLLSQFPGITTEFNYKSVKLGSAEIDAFQEGKPITLSGITLEIKQLKTIETLELSDTNVTDESLQKFLKEALKLKILNVSGCKNILGNWILETMFSEISSWDMEIATRNVKKKSLMNMPPSLTSFEFERMPYREPFEPFITAGMIAIGAGIWPPTDIPILTLPSLSLGSMKIKDMAIPTSDISPIPKMEDAFHASGSRLERLLIPGLIESLRELDLRNTNITAENLKKILKAASQLKKLYFSATNMVIDQELHKLLERFNLSTNVVLPTNEVPIVEEEHTPVDPPHNPQNYKDYKTKGTDDEPFVYRGGNKTKNQAMIIEKLSQYFTITRQHVALIPKIQGGVCTALANYYIQQVKAQDNSVFKSWSFGLITSLFETTDGWDAFMHQVSEWNGKLETLMPPLRLHFDRLTRFIERYQISNAASADNYLGDNLAVFCNSCLKPFILHNPWHSIAVLPPEIGGDEWTIYDPNFNKGSCKVKKAELLATIHRAVGSCVSVETDEPIPAPKIDHPGRFIRDGGLVALRNCTNVDAMLEELKSMGRLTRDELSGLLLRDTKGVPAWALGIQSPKRAAFTYPLLKQFILENPADYLKQLQESLSETSEFQRHEYITKIIQLTTATADAVVIKKTLIDCIRTTSSSAVYERALQTWKKGKSSATTVEEYCLQCVKQDEIKKLLIECTSTRDVSAMHFALQAQCRATRRPLFYANSPDDLICSSPYVYRREDNTGAIRYSGGPLYDFLHAPRNACELPPVIVVNYENFNADDVIRFNSLLDKVRKVDGIPVAEDIKVIGLINISRPDCYQGSDFYSRFDSAEICPIESSKLQSAIPALPFSASASISSGFKIDIFNAYDWHERLLGRWVLDKDVLLYEEGELQKAIAAGATCLEIQNGLWENEDFLRFWREACLKGVIEHMGYKITLPESLRIICSNGYDWTSLKLSVKQEALLSTDTPIVLNPTSLSQFFTRYQVMEDNKLGRLDGHIKAAHGSVLNVHVTRTLTDDQWAMLLNECTLHDVKLNATSAPGILLLAELGSVPLPVITATLDLLRWDQSKTASTQVIQSTDIDTTVAILTQDADDWIVIDISECNGSDLLEKITGGLNLETMHFEFNRAESALLRSLNEGRRVILKGSFSPSLADEIATLLLERRAQSEPKGTLVLISDNKTSLHFASPVHHVVSNAEKIAQLGEMPSYVTTSLAPYLMQEQLSQLQSRRQFLMNHPGSISNAAWEGMTTVSKGITKLEPFDASTSLRDAITFTESRRNVVNHALEHSPFVFLSGLSGVGKSTFVQQEFCQEDDELFQGEASIHKWASAAVSADEPVDGKKRRKLLFIDEATLSPREWSNFEGLFANPPGILLDGTFHKLTTEHKVIFAGNPVSYGDERKLASFFQRHGNAVVFQTLPTAVLYERVLKPVFKGSILEEQAVDISIPLLEVYRFLCHHSSTDILISPRELQMMAMMVVSYCKQQTTPLDISKVTQYFAYELAKGLVPGSVRNEFNHKFKPSEPLVQKMVSAASASDFLITSSRAPAQQLINDMLSLRELRRSLGNETLSYGGLGGIIIEGEPGIGKSEMVLATLVASGYCEMHDFTAPSTTDKPFYRMPVSMSLDEKTKLLLKAFNEGAVVIIDEINSSPMMERLLNDLLMGQHEGKRPLRPGFMVIGTQNPVTMAGRRVPSTALSRRLTTIELPPYSVEEMHEILCAKGLPKISITTMVNTYQQQAAYAKRHHLTPAPTFRDVIKLAEEVMKSKDIEPMDLSTEVLGNPFSFFAPIAAKDTSLCHLAPSILVP